MALNSSGQISLGGATTGESVNLELQQSATATITLDDTNVRTLFGVSSGQISLNTGWGKSAGNTWFRHSYGLSGTIFTRATQTSNKSILVATSSGLLNYSPAGTLNWGKGGNIASALQYHEGTNTFVLKTGSADANVSVYDMTPTKLYEFSFGSSASDSYGNSAGNKQWDGTYIYECNYYDPTDDAEFIKVSNSGVVFARYYGNNVTTSPDTYGYGASYDRSGNLYGLVATGLSSFSGTQQNMHLIKYSSSGVLQWHRRFGAATYIDASGLQTTSTGDTVVAGYVNSGYYWIAKVDTNGNQLWQRSFQEAINYGTFTNSVHIAPNGDIYFAFNQKYAKYNSSGTLQWIKHFVLTGEPAVPKIAYAISRVDSSGDIVVTGQLPVRQENLPYVSMYNAGGVTNFYAPFIASFKEADLLANKVFSASGDTYLTSNVSVATPSYTEGGAVLSFDATGFGAESAFACNFASTNNLNFTGDVAPTSYKRT
jgi:hypothetical protein